MKIRVTYDCPPIPIRDMDYSAIDDDTYDGAPDAGHHPHGHGATEDAAIDELAAQWDDAVEVEELDRLAAVAAEANDTTTLRFLAAYRTLYDL